MTEEKRTVGKNGPLTPMTKYEIYEIMITEAENEKTRCEILNRMHMRLSIAGSNKQMHDQFMGKHQAQIRQSKESIEHLTALRDQDLREDADKAKPVDIPVDKPKKGEKIEK